MPLIPELGIAAPEINGKTLLKHKIEVIGGAFRLLTPLLGGGAIARQCAEPDAIVHPLQVRGLLRKWWRASAGAQTCKDSFELRKREDPIWGLWRPAD